ncbi:MAG: molybdopterin dinucleotide binding domain-containing protein [Methanofollis sp.]|uniref:molybdopterin dinucleotide binding domain-containing protein n=1 Tax=Methanofollis sp. TaxID=2052835 RepID=UPI002608F5A5|nr:molybdopterin dinucleotide binding domain-containing protein [Methanofollis sp.]MDD4255870.1 molybdopterin dinucleotide binding domain-containing protein [Methanofollis sp.]
MRFLFNTGRTAAQGIGLDRKAGAEYAEATSRCLMNPVDMMDLDVEAGDHLLVRGPAGEVALSVVPVEGTPRGMVFVPLGPYANHILGGETHGTGMPDFKTMTVEIEPTEREVPTVADLMEEIGGAAYSPEEMP